jgi:hypothetical protein
VAARLRCGPDAANRAMAFGGPDLDKGAFPVGVTSGVVENTALHRFVGSGRPRAVVPKFMILLMSQLSLGPSQGRVAPSLARATVVRSTEAFRRDARVLPRAEEAIMGEITSSRSTRRRATAVAAASAGDHPVWHPVDGDGP